MSTKLQLAFAAALCGSLVFVAYWVQRQAAADAASMPANPPASAPNETGDSCPHCLKADLTANGSPTGFAPGGLPTATDWIAADARNPIKNLDIRFTDQEGGKGILRDLVDKPVLITFFYTRCQNSNKCSAAISRSAALCRRLSQAGMQDQVRLLAISYEPHFDTPERIKRYGLDRGLPYGDSVRAIQLDLDRYQQLIDELEAPVNYNAGWVNTHGVELFLIDSKGRLARKYHTVLWENDQVIADLGQLLADR